MESTFNTGRRFLRELRKELARGGQIRAPKHHDVSRINIPAGINEAFPYKSVTSRRSELEGRENETKGRTLAQVRE